MSPPTLMYDAVTIGEIPEAARAVLLYVDGAYANWKEGVERFEYYHGARKVSITTSGGIAEFADVETGDLTPASGVRWLERMISHHVYRPGLYANRSTWEGPGGLWDMIEALKIPRRAFRAMVADPDRHGVGITPALSPYRYYDACQNLWTPGYDRSTLRPDFWPPEPQPRVHRKVKASTGGAALATVILALLHQAGVHLTPAEAAAVTTITGSVSGWVTPSR